MQKLLSSTMASYLLGLYVTLLMTCLTTSSSVLDCKKAAELPANCKPEGKIISCCNATVLLYNKTTAVGGVEIGEVGEKFWPADIEELTLADSLTQLEVLDKVPYVNLKTLHFQSIGLRYIRDGAFSDLEQLVTLTLMQNYLSSLSPRTFAGLGSLVTLYLDENRLFGIEPATFSGTVLPSLESLSLPDFGLLAPQDDGLQAWSPPLDGKTCCESLQLLDLSYNQMTSLDTANLRLPASLRGLSLKYNAITAVSLSGDSSSSAEQVTKKPSVAGNVTSNITTVSSLNDLYLSGNRIERIDPKSLAQFTNLMTLDLSFNKLSVVDVTDWPWKTLTKVFVHDNPWNCSECVSAWIVLREVVINSNENKSAVVCATPSFYAGTSLFNVTALTTSCKPSSDGAAGATRVLVGILLCVIIVAILLLFVVVIRRRRAGCRRRAPTLGRGSPKSGGANGSGIYSSSTGGGGGGSSMAYRPMGDLEHYSISDDRD